MVLDSIFGLVLVKYNIKNNLSKFCQKYGFCEFFIFYCFEYFESIFVKIEDIKNSFFIKMLRIESSTNPRCLIKIGDNFFYTWLRFHGHTCILPLCEEEGHYRHAFIRMILAH
jgi:hypothetical protein